MDYEKKYKEALERARKSHDNAHGLIKKEWIETIFPELKESVDERIRKALLKLVHDNTENDVWHNHNIHKEEALAWLEKQVETKKPTRDQVWDYCSKISHEWWQITMDKINTLTDEEKSHYNQFIGFNDFSDTLMNITAGALFQLIDTGKLEYEEGSLLLEKPDDTPMPIEEQGSQNLANSAKTCKVEPKFKVGDWITICDGKAHQIVKVDYDGDGFTLDDDTYFRNSWKGTEHLWTIADAKDGDILTWNNSKCIVLFKNRSDAESFRSHGFVGGCTGKFKSGVLHDLQGAHPATKEQCNIFFSKMKEAGYEWDAEQKKLKKIE